MSTPIRPPDAPSPVPSSPSDPGGLGPAARERAIALLRRAADWLGTEAEGGRHHPSLAREVGGLARLVDLDDVAEAMVSHLDAAPPHAFPSIRASDPGNSIPPVPNRSLPDATALIFDYPVYDPDWIRSYLGNFEDAHVSAALRRRDDEAQEACASELDWEEYLAMVAFRGDHRAALAGLAARDLAQPRHLTPRLVVAVEAGRQGDDALCGEVLDALVDDCGAWEWVQLAAGFLGRVPWNGYPLPDY